MTHNQSLEEVMQRIRARTEERRLRNSPDSSTEEEASRGVKKGSTRDEDTGPTPQLETPVNDLVPLRIEIDTALEGSRRVGQLNPRNPGLLNSVIQFFKKVMRRSLSWYTRPIHYFQGGVIRSLQQIEALLQSHERSLRVVWAEFNRQHRQYEVTEEKLADLGRQILASGEILTETNAGQGRLRDSLERELSAMGDRVSSLQAELESSSARIASAQSATILAQEQVIASHGQRMEGFTSEIETVRSAIDQANESLRTVQLQIRLRDRDLRRFLHDLRSGLVTPLVPDNITPVPQMFPAGIHRETDFDYFSFEDLYRGDEADISRRQIAYLEYFRGRANVLDVGCGRGEFLELLRKNEISAKGVELGIDQFLLCKEKGLDVVQQDLFSYLESLPDGSLGGLFSAQVIEHLTASDQLRYVALAYQKTMPESPVIFETINAQCVWAVMRNFFLDPTHVRPVHPDTLKFAMESVRFKNVELHFSSPLKERQIPPLQAGDSVLNLAEFNSRIEELNQLLYGDQDYAAIGWH